jgi:hypothetical protein
MSLQFPFEFAWFRQPDDPSYGNCCAHDRSHTLPGEIWASRTTKILQVNKAFFGSNRTILAVSNKFTTIAQIWGLGCDNLNLVIVKQDFVESRAAVAATAASSFPRTHRAFALLGYCVFSVICASILLELVSFVLIFSFRAGTQEEGDLRLSPAYDGFVWAPELVRQERRRFEYQRQEQYQPFRIWGANVWHGRYVNVDKSAAGTVRRTINVASGACSNPANPKRKVWIFGGSTVFGTGVPDFATVASYLSQHLSEGSSACFEVTNFGVEGYGTNQEVIWLEEQLKRGLRPDAVIFYDGVNDAYQGCVSPADPFAHLNLEQISGRVEGRLQSRVDFLKDTYSFRIVRALVSRIRRAPPQSPPASELTAPAKATLANYEANLAVVSALGQFYHFRAIAFWQPAFITGDKPLVPFEQDLLRRRVADPNGWLRAMRKAYERAEKRAAESGHFVFLGHVFDGVSNPLYLDGWMHLGPLGNDIVAQRIATEVRKDVETLGE